MSLYDPEKTYWKLSATVYCVSLLMSENIKLKQSITPEIIWFYSYIKCSSPIVHRGSTMKGEIWHSCWEKQTLPRFFSRKLRRLQILEQMLLPEMKKTLKNNKWFINKGNKHLHELQTEASVLKLTLSLWRRWYWTRVQPHHRSCIGKFYM